MSTLDVVNGAPCDSASLELKRRIATFLHQRGVSSVRRLNIEVSNGVVTLDGTVSTFYERQICISCCKHVAGVMRLVDNLEVH